MDLKCACKPEGWGLHREDEIGAPVMAKVAAAWGLGPLTSEKWGRFHTSSPYQLLMSSN